MDRVNHLWPDIAALTPRGLCLVAVNWMACAHTLASTPYLKLARDSKHLSTQRLRATCGGRGKKHMNDRNYLRDFGEKSPALFAKFGPKFHTRARAFMWVCEHGNLAMCRVLREWGMSVQDIRTGMHSVGINMSLERAAANGHLPIFQVLKEWADPLNGSDAAKLDCLTVQDLRFDMCIILSAAAYNGHLEVCQYLKDWRDRNPLSDGTWDCLTVNDARDAENDVLMGCARTGHVHVLQFLKDWRDPPSASKPDGDWLTIEDVRDNSRLALKWAARCGHVNVLQFLKDWIFPDGSRLTLQDVRDDNNLVLKWAAKKGHAHVLAFCKSWVDPDGSRLTLQDVRANNNHALRNAAMNGHLGVCQFLKDWRDDDGRNETLWLPGVGLGIADLLDFEPINPAWHENVIPKTRDFNALQLAERNGHMQVHKFLKDWETHQMAYTMAASFLYMIDPSLLQTLLSQLLPQ
jgi:hypothetical protein